MSALKEDNALLKTQNTQFLTLSKTRAPDEQLQSEYTELQDRFKQL